MKLSKRYDQIVAGDLKDRCKLLQPTSTSNGRGGSAVSYSEYAEVWVKAMPANNSRTLSEAQVTFFDAFKFTIRTSEIPVNANWQITFNNRTYTIHSVHDINNAYQYLEILAYSKKL